MKSLLIALAIAGLSCLSFNVNASNQPLQQENFEISLAELGGGIIDIISTATDIEISATPDTPGAVTLDIFDNSGRRVVGETTVVNGTTTFRYPKSVFTAGGYEVVVKFPTGIEVGQFKI